MAQDLFVLAYALAYITFAFGLLSFIARFYSRALVVKSWGWDDSASVAVFIVNIVHQVVLQLFLNYDCGRPNNPQCGFTALGLLRTAFIEEIVIYAAHFTIKTTFLFFYMRLSNEKTFRILVYVGFAFNVSVFLSSMLMTVLQCIPFEKILNPMLHPEVKCLSTRLVMLTPPIMNIAMDFYILFVPIRTVWTLQMTLRRRLTILSVLCFGLVSVTVAIVRLPVLFSVTSGFSDVSIDVGRMVIVAAFEVQCAIIAVNLPALKPLWGRVRGRFGSTEGSKETPSHRPYKLSSLKGDKKRSSMGSVTRLERGIISNESEEELCSKKNVSTHVDATEVHTNNNRGSNRISNQAIAKDSITITTHVDVRRN